MVKVRIVLNMDGDIISPALKSCMAELKEKEERDYPGISHRKVRQALCYGESTLLGVCSSVQTQAQKHFSWLVPLVTRTALHTTLLAHTAPLLVPLSDKSSAGAVPLDSPHCVTAAALDLSERHRSLQCKIGRITPFLLRGSSLIHSPALHKLDELHSNNRNKKKKLVQTQSPNINSFQKVLHDMSWEKLWQDWSCRQCSAIKNNWPCFRGEIYTHTCV